MHINEKYLRLLFVVGMIGKGFDGTVELIAGVLLLFPGVVDSLVKALVAHELIQDPHDALANAIMHLLPHVLAYATTFAAIYILSHGLIKLVLVVALLRNELWAYPTAIVVFVLFIAYQVYDYIVHPSVALIIFTVLDVFIIALTWHEWHYMLRRRESRRVAVAATLKEEYSSVHR